MIIWIASYPKSGNTWVRLFLKSYFSNENEELNINEDIQIPSFPEPKYFDSLNIDYTKIIEIIKHWKLIQDSINLNGQTNFLKTHNGMFKIKDYKFTDSSNTLGAIYIVRDPRDIVVSFANHFGKPFGQTVDAILSSQNVEKMEYKNKIYTNSIMGKWSDHYNSWKSYNLTNILIIKYEDLIENPHKSFLRILEYLKNKNNTEININKMNKAINETNFNNLRKKEDNYGFKEKSIHGRFFRKGIAGEWKYSLDKDLVKKIENAFGEEMRELGYL